MNDTAPSVSEPQEKPHCHWCGLLESEHLEAKCSTRHGFEFRPCIVCAATSTRYRAPTSAAPHDGEDEQKLAQLAISDPVVLTEGSIRKLGRFVAARAPQAETERLEQLEDLVRVCEKIIRDARLPEGDELDPVTLQRIVDRASRKLSAQGGDAALRDEVTCCLSDPDMVTHLKHKDCEREEPHKWDECGVVHPPTGDAALREDDVDNLRTAARTLRFYGTQVEGREAHTAIVSAGRLEVLAEVVDYALTARPEGAAPVDETAKLMGAEGAAQIKEESRQTMLLGLAELSLRRPGWIDHLGRIADTLSGRDMFEGFRETSRDLVGPAEGAAQPDDAPQTTVSGGVRPERVVAAQPEERSPVERKAIAQGKVPSDSSRTALREARVELEKAARSLLVAADDAQLPRERREALRSALFWVAELTARMRRSR